MPISNTDIEKVVTQESICVKKLRELLSKNATIIITSDRRGVAPVGIGSGLSAKFATIVGTSSQQTDISSVIKKAKAAMRLGASVIHNGSTSGDIDEVKKALLKTTTVPLAMCHPLAVMGKACMKKRNFTGIKPSEFIDEVEKDMAQGAEIVLLPIGVTKKNLKIMLSSKRIMPCCGKSGSLMAAWMMQTKQENPYCLHFDKILEMAKRYNTTLSVVGAFRSGCLHDALDRLQFSELKTISEYVKLAKEAGVQIKAGSGGHIPADKINWFLSYQKKLLKTPIISFGPQVTDISLGYDHVSAAMGQLQALISGADIIFSITPAEHISMPDEKETEEGCIIANIVCHAADAAKGKGIDKDLAVSKAREKMLWQKQSEFTLSPDVKKRLKSMGFKKRGCSVCGDFCAHELKIKALENK